MVAWRADPDKSASIAAGGWLFSRRQVPERPESEQLQGRRRIEGVRVEVALVCRRQRLTDSDGCWRGLDGCRRWRDECRYIDRVSDLADIGVIGGSGFYEFLDSRDEFEIDTPYGRPSDPVAVGEIGGKLRKIFSPVGIVFKGSGFYRTDSRNGASSVTAKESSANGSNGSSSESSSGSSDSAKSDSAKSGSASGDSGSSTSSTTTSGDKKSSSVSSAAAS